MNYKIANRQHLFWQYRGNLIHVQLNFDISQMSYVRFEILDLKFEMFNIIYQLSDIRYFMSYIRFLMSDVRCQISDINCKMLSIKVRYQKIFVRCARSGTNRYQFIAPTRFDWLMLQTDQLIKGNICIWQREVWTPVSMKS